MSLLHAIRYRLRALLDPNRHARDLQREMDLHLELDAAQQEHESQGALSQRDARLAARRRFGNVTYLKEEARRMTAVEWLDVIQRDVRFAGRGFRRAPAFAAGVVLTFALGIGANAAMFALIDRMLFRPPPHLQVPERVHRIYTMQTIRGQESISGADEYARYADFARWTSSFDRVAAFSEDDFPVGVGDAAREMRIAMVSASFFGFFDAPPALGRYFTPTEDTPGRGAHVAVISHTEWRTAFGGRPDIVGTKMRIDADVYEIIGVAGAGFAGLWPSQPPAYFVPIATVGDDRARTNLAPSQRDWWKTYHWNWIDMIARRAPGTTEARASADLTRAFVKSIEAEHAESPNGPPPASMRLRAAAGSILSERGPTPTGFSKVAAWLGGVAVIVLLIACANVCNLMIARALRRRREVALRLALGVSRRRLLAQLLTENLLLAGMGGLAGVIVAQWASAGLRAAFLPGARTFSVVDDERTLIFSLAAALVVGLVTGLAPMLHAGRATVADDLNSGARGGTLRQSRLRVALLIVQGSLSVALLIGAGLFVRSLRHVRDIRLGYDVDPILVVDFEMRGVELDSVRAVDLRRRLLERARSTPGVLNAALESGVPFWSTRRAALYVPGIDTVARLGRFDFSAVSPEYFDTFGTRILRGRGILKTDVEHAPLVMVVSKKMGNTLWPGTDPLGKCVRMQADTATCRTVVGVAEDIKSHALSIDPDMYYYVPATQFAPNRTALFVRVGGGAAPVADAVRRSLQREMPNPAYVTVTPFSDIVGEEVRSWKLGASMFTAFGLLALVLAGIGLYSVIAYTVAERTHEIGVRTALGAQRSRVVGLVVRDAVRMAVAGVVIGSVIALQAGQRLAPLLFDESPRDPAVYLVVALALTAVAAAASWVPARRASRIDPTVALRSQ